MTKAYSVADSTKSFVWRSINVSRKIGVIVDLEYVGGPELILDSVILSAVTAADPART